MRGRGACRRCVSSAPAAARPPAHACLGDALRHAKEEDGGEALGDEGREQLGEAVDADARLARHGDDGVDRVDLVVHKHRVHEHVAREHALCLPRAQRRVAVACVQQRRHRQRLRRRRVVLVRVRVLVCHDRAKRERELDVYGLWPFPGRLWAISPVSRPKLGTRAERIPGPVARALGVLCPGPPPSGERAALELLAH